MMERQSMSLLKIVMVRWKIGSFGFALVSACALGQNQMCQCAVAKIEFKKMCDGENNKY
jgi:hypothetical protein